MIMIEIKGSQTPYYWMQKKKNLWHVISYENFQTLKGVIGPKTLMYLEIIFMEENNYVRVW